MIKPLGGGQFMTTEYTNNDKFFEGKIKKKLIIIFKKISGHKNHKKMLTKT